MKSSLRALLFATLSLSSSHALADGLDSVFNDTINSVTEAINEAYHPDSSEASDDRRYDDESRTRYDERRRRLEERHRQLDERQRRLDEERRRLEEEEQRLEDDDYR